MICSPSGAWASRHHKGVPGEGSARSKNCHQSDCGQICIDNLTLVTYWPQLSGLLLRVHIQARVRSACVTEAASPASARDVSTEGGRSGPRLASTSRSLRARTSNRFYYDCLTHREPALRLIIDTVGIDQVVLGSDWPYDMGLDSPVEWVNSMNSLTAQEKTAIISDNPARLLGMSA